MFRTPLLRQKVSRQILQKPYKQQGPKHTLNPKPELESSPVCVLLLSMHMDRNINNGVLATCSLGSSAKKNHLSSHPLKAV